MCIDLFSLHPRQTKAQWDVPAWPCTRSPSPISLQLIILKRAILLRSKRVMLLTLMMRRRRRRRRVVGTKIVLVNVRDAPDQPLEVAEQQQRLAIRSGLGEALLVPLRFQSLRHAESQLWPP